MASNFDLNTESDDKQKEHLITIAYNKKKCKKLPEIVDNEDFYTLYSSKEFKLEPRDSTIINLGFNITSKSTEIDPWISLLPSIKNVGLQILSKTVRNNEIEGMLQNQSYHYTVEVKKCQVLAFIFMLGLNSKDYIKTEYVCNYEENS